MLKLPKIQEETSPLVKQYRDVLLSKNPQTKNFPKPPPSKYDWTTVELLIVDSVSHEAILKAMTNFQIACKQKQVKSFYSYFFLKSLFMNKNLKPQQKQNPQQPNLSTQQKPQESSNRPLTAQIQTFVVDKITQETKKIQAQTSAYHKIQNCIALREELLDHFFGDSASDSQALIHQNANHVRYLNFELIEIIKSWKSTLNLLQTKTFTGQNLSLDSLQIMEPIYVYEDHNYLCKIIYDNANAINTANSKKSSKFISPPNPFFLSQDGNKQSMSQKEKNRIEDVMELIAKEKALQLKLMLDQPEYISKKINPREVLRSSSTTRLKAQKSSQSYRKDDPFKKNFGSLSKLQLPQKKYQSIKQIPAEKSVPKKEQYFSTASQRGKTENQDKILSIYQARASKLREQVEKNSETRDKFETMVKKSELEMLRDLRKKKSPPKQSPLPKFTVEPKTFEERLKESPYKDRVSSLRREVEKNVIAVKLNKKEIAPRVQLDESILTFKSQNPIKRPVVEVKTQTPKIKLVEQKQVVVEKVANPVVVQQKAVDEKVKDKSLSRSKEKEEKKKSFSTFYKTAEEEELQKSIIRERKMRSSQIMQKMEVGESKILESVGEEVEKLNKVDKVEKVKVQKKTLDANKSATSSNFYKREVDVRSEHGSKRKSSQPNIIKDKSTNRRNEQAMRDNIDTSLKNLKERLRNMEIMKAYGKGASRVKKREQSEMSLSAIREDDNLYKASPKKKEVIEKRNRSTFLKKQAEMLESKIEKLLRNQETSFRFNKGSSSRIYEEDEEHNQYRSINRLNDLHSERLSETESIFDDNLKNLRKKQELIHQSNQMKQKQIEKTTKSKSKIEEEVNQRRERVQKMEEKIEEMKKKRKANASQSQEKLKQSLLSQSRELVSGEQALKVKQLKQTQNEMKKQNQNLRLQMIQEQQKFIKLKEEEYKMREELNRKKYLEELQEVKSKYIIKQQQYEQKILEEERIRKENEIRLMKEKREIQQLQMKLHEQEMKELLLKDILQKENERWQKQDKEADMYHYEVKKIISAQIKEKEEEEWEVNKIYLEENYKLMTLMNEMREKNFKIEEANKLRLAEVERTIKEKEEEIKKLEELEMQVQKLQKSRMELAQQDQIQAVSLPITNSAYVPLEEDDLEDLKLRLKEEILKQMIERRKREQQEELKFQQERKRRLKILENQIKDFLRKQGEISKVLEYTKPDEMKNINVESILNREVLHQEQMEILTKTKSIEDLRKEVNLADKEMTTLTTDNQTNYGERYKKDPQNRSNEYPKSSLKQVLDSHSTKHEKPQKQQNSSAISNESKTNEGRQKSPGRPEPDQQRSKINSYPEEVPVNQKKDLSQIEEVDRSHEYVPTKNDQPEMRQTKRSQKLQSDDRHNQQRTPSRNNSVHPSTKDNHIEKDSFKKPTQKFHEKTPQKDGQRSNQKSQDKSPNKSSSKFYQETPKQQSRDTKQASKQQKGRSVSNRRESSDNEPSRDKIQKNVSNEKAEEKNSQKYDENSRKQKEKKERQPDSEKYQQQRERRQERVETKNQNPQQNKRTYDEVSEGILKKSKIQKQDEYDRKQRNQRESSEQKPREKPKQKVQQESDVKPKGNFTDSPFKSQRKSDPELQEQNPKYKPKEQKQRTDSKRGTRSKLTKQKPQQRQSDYNNSQRQGEGYQKKAKRQKNDDESEPEKYSKPSNNQKYQKQEESDYEKAKQKYDEKVEKIVKPKLGSDDEEPVQKKPIKKLPSEEEQVPQKKPVKNYEQSEDERRPAQKQLQNQYPKKQQQSEEERPIKKHSQNQPVKKNQESEEEPPVVKKQSQNQSQYKNVDSPSKKVTKNESSGKEELPKSKKFKQEQSQEEQPSKKKRVEDQSEKQEQKRRKNHQQESEPEKKPKKKQQKLSESEEDESRKRKHQKREESQVEEPPTVKPSKRPESGRLTLERDHKKTDKPQKLQRNEVNQKPKKSSEPYEIVQKAKKDLIREKPSEKQPQIPSANNSIVRKFGDISSMQEYESKQIEDKSKIQNDNSYVSVSKPNDTIDESLSVKQRVFKSDEEMLQKFQALKEYLKPEAQFVMIEEAQIEGFLDKFYASYPEEVQEMFSFTKSELLTILKNFNSMQRKIDLFDCQSIGWFDRANNKYILIGSIGCVHLIAQKYGQIQIEMSYVFNRSNHKQKKYLVKQIKVFEKVGSLFQKKLEQENHYSLKLIIKITKEMIGEESHVPDELVHFNSVVVMLANPPTRTKIKKSDKQKLIFEHVLADCMWQHLKKQQIQEFAVNTAKDSIDLNVFAKSLQSFNQEQACKQLKDYISNETQMTAELDMYFKLPYIQLGKRVHYQLKADQYQLKNGEKVFLSKHWQETEDDEALWKFLIFETSKTVMEDNFIETLLKAKVKQLNKLKPQRELNLVLPLFKIDQSFTADQSQGLKQNYRHKTLIDGDLIRSSISCANSTVEQERKLITLSKKTPEMGFVFCACYAPGEEIQKVVAGSWVGYPDLIR